MTSPAPGEPARVGDVSFWYADMGGMPARRPPLSGDAEADVCIVGAGYTGLWTAWYLRQHAPALKVVLVEKEFAGFGASGRNGGWLTGGFAWNHERYLANGDRDGVRALVQAMNGTVDEVIRVAGEQGIDADIRRTDELMVATNLAQLERAKAEVAHRQAWGEGEGRVYLVDGEAARARVRIPGTIGGMIVTGVARVQPAKLVRGLAAAVERAGARIFEGTPALGIEPGRVTTPFGQVRAPVILRATEGFTTTLPGLKRDWLPLNSAQIVTEPLPPEVWQNIGWDGCELLGDMANAYCYCQRTREGRIAVGGRGEPYRMGSGIDTLGRPGRGTIAWLTEILYRHFPETRRFRIDHAWCGVLGVPRDWCASVGLDRSTGIGWAGGYVGVGVSTSNLAGRTLADLALNRDTDLTRLPWVNHRPRRWEPEPLRWLGVHGMYALLNAADRRERASNGPPSRLGRLGNWLTGR